MPEAADGVLPVPDTTHYPLSEAATAIRVMGAAGHTGKLVLDIPHTGEFEAVLSPEQAPVYRADGSYIVTGGLSGLGLFLAAKLAAGGCGRIVLNARSEPSAATAKAIEAVRSKGAEVEVEVGGWGPFDAAVLSEVGGVAQAGEAVIAGAFQ